MGDPVPAGDGQLKVGPEGSHLPQRIIEVGDIHEEADEEPGGEMTDGNKVNAISQDDELPHAGQESEHGNIYVVGDAGFYRGRIVDIVGFRKTPTKVVTAVEGQDDLEITQAFLYLGAHAARGL